MLLSLVTFTLLAGALASYLSRNLGLLGDVLCWLSLKRGDFGCNKSSQLSSSAQLDHEVITSVYMISASGCSHCARAMPEFTKFQNWCAERPELSGYEAFVLRPNEISRIVQDDREAHKLLSNGVPLYIVVNRTASKNIESQMSVYNGRRKASDILDFARKTRSTFLSSSH